MEALLESLKSRATDAGAMYVQLCLQTADGAAVDPDDARRVLGDAGKTAEDLTADVATVLARRRARQRMEAGASAGKERARLARELRAAQQRIDAELAAALDAARAKADAQRAAVVAPLEAQLATADEQVADAGRAANFLISTADASARTEVERLEAALAAANGRATEARDLAADRRQREERAKTVAEVLKKDPKLRTAQEQVLADRQHHGQPGSWLAAAERAAKEAQDYERQAQQHDELAERLGEQLEQAHRRLLTVR